MGSDVPIIRDVEVTTKLSNSTAPSTAPVAHSWSLDLVFHIDLGLSDNFNLLSRERRTSELRNL